MEQRRPNPLRFGSHMMDRSLKRLDRGGSSRDRDAEWQHCALFAAREIETGSASTEAEMAGMAPYRVGGSPAHSSPSRRLLPHVSHRDRPRPQFWRALLCCDRMVSDNSSPLVSACQTRLPC